MTILIVVLGAGLLLTGAAARARLRERRSPAAPTGGPRILFPFLAQALSPRALDAALRLARTEQGTLVPTFLAIVPRHLPLDSALPRQGELALSLQEAIEQRASTLGVPVDARLERGRDTRHALRHAIATEHFDRVVAAVSANGAPGFSPTDIAWLLDHAPGEIIALRPEPGHTPQAR